MEGVLPLPVPGSPASKAEVVIAGAGPVGLTLGCLLRKAGVDVVIVDPHFEQGQASKAAVTLPRSLEVLEQAGAAAEIVETGRQTEGVRVSVGQGSWQGEGFNFGHHVSQPCRYRAQDIGQCYVEAALLKSYLKLGGRLYRAARVLECQESDSGVDVQVERHGYVRPPTPTPQFPPHLLQVAKTTFRASYLVGCDGKNSAVRKSMSWTLTGHEYPQSFFLADAEWSEEEVAKVGMDRHTIQSVINGPAGIFLFAVRMQGNLWRLYFGQKDLEPKLLTEQFMWDAFSKYWPAPGLPKNGKILDLAHFAVSCAMVDTYRKGRVLLAGDAAHHHSPAGGQGMNTGIQDAGNLGWKLVAVLRGQAGDSLLNTYDAERVPIAKWVLSTSDGLFSAISKTTSRPFAFVRTLFLKTVFCCVPSSNFPPDFLKGKVFGLGHTYKAAGTCQDLGVGGSRKSVRAGDRMPDLPCFDSGGTLVYTLKLLADPSGFGSYHAFFVEGGPGFPNDERSNAVQAFTKAIHGRLPMRCFLYVSKLEKSPPQSTAQLSALAPQVAPLLPTLQDELRMSSSERVLIIARPDGYVAVVQRGPAWDSAGAGRALLKLACLPSSPGV